jgi:hypothetical protein
MGNLAKFKALPGDEKRLVAAAAVLLPLTDLALRTFGYQKTQDFLAANTADRKVLPFSPADRMTRSQRVAYCVRVAARRGPYRATCLRESLVTWWLLRRRGIPATLRIGVGKEAADLKAHAWVEVDGQSIIDGEEALRDFAGIHQLGDRGKL